MSAIDLRLGRWQEALADVGMVDCLISDPPYSERTAKGFHTGKDGSGAGFRSEPIAYGWIDEAYCHAFIDAWSKRVKTWFVVFGDHVTSRWFESAMQQSGLYTFPPLPWVKLDAAPRFMCDGPSSQAEWIVVARQRCNVAKRYRPGHYTTHQVKAGAMSSVVDGAKIVTGQKPVNLIRAIVRDYSEPGDLIAEPHAGSGSTLLAAAIEGRRAIGAEMDPVTHAKAMKRIAKGYTPNMFVEQRPEPDQVGMFGSDE